MKTSKLLVAVVVLQGLLLVSQWTGSGPVTPAYGQIPDAERQRIQLVDEMKNLGEKLDKIAELLKSGEVQVKVVTSDEKK